eukprot:14748539-Alexandrium_andersonii.AAC.1
MSASLVGSEMCIRDRQRAGRPGQPGQPRDLRPQGQQAAAGGRPRGAGAVSYTHLTLPTICSV